MLKERNLDHACTVIIKHGSPSHPLLLEGYKKLAQDILKNNLVKSVEKLKDILYHVIYGPSSISQAKLSEQLEVYLQVAHLLDMRAKCAKKKELGSFAAKISISLLRYTTIIPADIAFMEAGQYAKNAGMNNMAFVCWNRFLDLCEAIEEGTHLMENVDFQNTDVPFDALMSDSLVDEKKREEIRDWVLQISLDHKVNQELDKRECECCGTSVYAAQLICPKTRSVSAPCLITGYPVLKSSVKCTSCGRGANKDDWNKYIMTERACPWCKASQTPIYF